MAIVSHMSTWSFVVRLFVGGSPVQSLASAAIAKFNFQATYFQLNYSGNYDAKWLEVKSGINKNSPFIIGSYMA